LSWSRATCALPSFPTRRSSDLVVVFAPAGAMGVRENIDLDTLAPLPLGRARIHRTGSDLTVVAVGHLVHDAIAIADELADEASIDRKSTRLNSSHVAISYAVFC